jgi:hypothetical protein
MGKKQKFTVGMCGVALILLPALPCCSDVTEPVNELKGKTLYQGQDYKTVFKADLTFEIFSREVVDYDPWPWVEDWVPATKGSYKYDSTKKTFTLNISQVWMAVILEDDEEVMRWLTKSDAPNDARFAPRSYKYTITKDRSLLAQRFITNKGTNQLKGETYTVVQMAGTPPEYTFAATGNTYSYTDSKQETTTGTYYFNETQKTVWLRPTLREGKTMVGYYKDISDYWVEIYTEEADKKASQTNITFASAEFTYDPGQKTFGRKYSW